ncbi:MAG TPA: tRNA 5-methoxyuridine(34)/uridine 5-oxyacetic acid(34) synthase CmoB [Pseudomonadaceae bacterium]|nr:tRNA 5-methoxyuridine(34)/uridine 5-oxyacetic acid(34) synthase CmoB [Pseudomonadaceae bacterium]
MPHSFLFDYQALREQLAGTPLDALSDCIPADLAANNRHGDFPAWHAALQALPELSPASVELKGALRIGTAAQLDDAGRAHLREQLMALHPWRKGPLELFGLPVDTEWRSDWKWDRVQPHISPLQGRTVLDVGCGNGYHCWRMAGAGAKLVIGVDSHLLFTMQYWAVRHFLRSEPVFVLPVALEALPEAMGAFDTVFSMGVFYHRRSPFDHLISLRHQLRPGGELVLETLVIEGEEGLTLVPQGRYARMPNVWFLPTCNTLHAWLGKSGYTDIRLVDLNRTSVEEQRSTAWMTFESLPEALDRKDPLQTIEGYPAPLRAVFVARKP